MWMQQGNAQPTAAHAQQSNEILRHSDATKATRGPQRRVRCRETKFCSTRMRQTQYATHSGVRTARNASLGRSTATMAARNPQRRTHCRATKFFGIRMRRRQCVAHSGVRTAEQRNPCTPIRSPQRRTHCRATKFIDPWLPRDAVVSLYQKYWLSTF